MYVIRDARTVVGLSHHPALAPGPWTHASDLLYELINDDALAGEAVTEKVLRKYYLAACRGDRVRPLPWLAVLRQLNGLLRQIYGSAYQKSYRNVYEGGRLCKRRVYRIPRVEEIEQARARGRDAVVELAEEKRRRA
jgi:hypothetical protein